MVKLKSLPSVYFVARLIYLLSTVSMDSLYSNLKVITKPFDINQKRLPFKIKKLVPIKLISWVYRNLNITRVEEQVQQAW